MLEEWTWNQSLLESPLTITLELDSLNSNSNDGSPSKSGSQGTATHSQKKFRKAQNSLRCAQPNTCNLQNSIRLNFLPIRIYSKTPKMNYLLKRQNLETVNSMKIEIYSFFSRNLICSKFKAFAQHAVRKWTEESSLRKGQQTLEESSGTEQNKIE